MKKSKNHFRKGLYVFLAGFFFLVGVLGFVVPGLPGTPFFLLTSYFLVRSYPKLNDVLLRSRWIGPILKDWQTKGGVQTRVKVGAISFVLLAVSLSLVFANVSPIYKFAVLVSALVGLVVILRLPTVK